MNWRPTARKDVRDSIRSRTIWILLVAFVGLFILGNVVFGSSSGPFGEFVDRTFSSLSGLLPLIGIVIGYKAVIHERESGSLVLALSLPQSRWDFAVGKLVGRSLVLAIPVVAGLLVAGAIAATQYDSVSPVSYLTFVGLSVLYGTAFVSIAVACSMSSTAGRQVLVRAIGAYVVLDQVWVWLVETFVVVLYRFDSSIVSDLPDWAVILQLASPSEAYRHVVSVLFEFDSSRAHLAAETPWVVNSWTALVVLLAWVGVPIALAYLWFGTADL